MAVREATDDDLLEVVSVLDAALLDLGASAVGRRIDAGTVLVAVEEGRVLGACVCVRQEDGVHVEAIAVRQARRDQGIGSALLDAAAERWGRLTANFDAHVRPFYESLGFAVEDGPGGRYRGVLE